MGQPMAKRLLEAGHELAVFDINSEAVQTLVGLGATAKATPQEVASAAETVLISLPTPQIVHDVVLGSEGVTQGSSVRRIVDLSTTGPAMAKRISAALSSHGVVWIDAPVSGGIKGAAKGTLAIMVSGPEAEANALFEMLEILGKPFFTGTAAGAGQVVKLGNNMMAAAAMVVSAEALAMGVKAGVDPALMNEIINISSGRNSATQDKIPGHVLTGTFDYGFATGLSYKDVRLCVDEAAALGTPMLAGSLVREILSITNAKYGPQSDFTSIARVIEEWAGCEIRSPTENQIKQGEERT